MSSGSDEDFGDGRQNALTAERSGEERMQFKWDVYLKQKNAYAAEPEWFWQSLSPPKNLFKVGQKLESVDPRNASITSVATVQEVWGPKILLRLDGGGRTNDYWMMVDSGQIHPFGFTEKNGGFLQPPLSFEKNPTRYQSVINAARDCGNLAPDECFMPEPPRPTSNLFKLGMKLEAINALNPTDIYPATVVGRERDKIRIEYDDWKECDLIRYDSRDIYPCGWWEKAGKELVHPNMGAIQLHESGRNRGGWRGRGRGRMNRPFVGSRASSSGPASSRLSSENRPRSVEVETAVQLEIPSVRKITPPSLSPVQTPNKESVQIPQTEVAAVAKRAHTTGSPSNFARKSIPQPKLDNGTPSTPTVNFSTGTRLNNGASNDEKINGKNDDYDIPQPDTVIVNFDVEKLVLRVNSDCDAGPFIDKEQLIARLKIMPKQMSLNNIVQHAFQAMIDAADSGEVVFNVIPGVFVKSPKAMTVIATDKNGHSIVRYIPTYDTAVAGRQALTEVLGKLKACPNLLTSETGCDFCSVPPTKKSKLTNETSSDTGRKEIASTSTAAAAGDNSRDTPDTAAWSLSQDPSTWQVEDVLRFIENAIDKSCTEPFLTHGVDGKALIHLTTDMMIQYMGIRVGPAVKISNAIERLKGTSRPSNSHTGKE